MSVNYHLWVPGIPRPQPRPRFFKTWAYNPKSADEWKKMVTALLVNSRVGNKDAQIEGPVSVDLTFRLPAPKSSKGKLSMWWHTKKPDIDNLTKAVMDAATAAGVWKDDAQVCSLSAKKRYMSANPGCEVVIQEMGD